MLLASGSQDNYIRVWRISSRAKLLDEDALTDELRLKEDSFTITVQGLFLLFFHFSASVLLFLL